MYPDFKELLSVFNAHRVKYLVVGAYAVSIHAQPRATKDLDILVKADARNAKAVLAALAEFGAPLVGLTAGDFAEPGPFFRIGRTPVAVDILTEIPAVAFDAAWRRRVAGVIDPASGLKADFISADDLIAAVPSSVQVSLAAEARQLSGKGMKNPSPEGRSAQALGLLPPLVRPDAAVVSVGMCGVRLQVLCRRQRVRLAGNALGGELTDANPKDRRGLSAILAI